VGFAILHADARGILSKTGGFIAEAGFTHSLTPARNCGFACSYCYVPTMGIYAGLKPDDWKHWGAFTTFKSNAAELLGRTLRNDQTIYCSPLVDPYQPAEESERMMPRLLDAMIKRPPRALTIQTRGPLILRDLEQLVDLSRKSRLRVSFSLTTDRDDVRRFYEPLCAPISTRLQVMRDLRDAGIAVHATLAPLLPCDPDRLLDMALETTTAAIICDPFHTRATKPSGATTRDPAVRLSSKRGFSEWHEPAFQSAIVSKLRARAAAAGRKFDVGTAGFRFLLEDAA
jgi:DNA repair photolyase